MFTTGQWIFAALFFVAFVIAAFYAYGKDKALHSKVYKGSYKIPILPDTRLRKKHKSKDRFTGCQRR